MSTEPAALETAIVSKATDLVVSLVNNAGLPPAMQMLARPLAEQAIGVLLHTGDAAKALRVLEALLEGRRLLVAAMNS